MILSETVLPHLDAHETMFLSPLTDGFRLYDLVVASVCVGFDPTNVFETPEVPFLQALGRRRRES